MMDSRDFWLAMTTAFLVAVPSIIMALRGQYNTNQKLEIIHKLVNSAYTASIQDTYDQTTLLLASLKNSNRINPDDDITAEITRAEDKLKELATTIKERGRAVAEAN